MKKAFTLIEILVVATIICLLALAGFVSYSQFMKQSRDAKRKADIEIIRSAIEMYRSTNNLYPTSPVSPPGLPFGTAGLVDTNTPPNTYMSKIPTDPQENGLYYYSSNGSTYTLGIHLESTTSVCTPALAAPSCNTTTAACNYCMGPYGQL